MDGDRGRRRRWRRRIEVERRYAGAGADRRSAVKAFDRGKQRIGASRGVVDGPGRDARADDDRRNVIGVGHRWIGVVFVEGNDQQRIVGLRPGSVGGEIGLDPGIARRNPAAVVARRRHVVVVVGRNKRDGWKVGKAGRGLRKRAEIVTVIGRIGEVDPRLAFGDHRGFGVTAEGVTVGGERARQRRYAGRKLGNGAVAGDALRRAGKQGNVIGLTRMGHTVDSW